MAATWGTTPLSVTCSRNSAPAPANVEPADCWMRAPAACRTTVAARCVALRPCRTPGPAGWRGPRPAASSREARGRQPLFAFPIRFALLDEGGNALCGVLGHRVQRQHVVQVVQRVS